MKVEELIKQAMVPAGKKAKKTKNHDLFCNTIIALAEDDDHISTFVRSVSSSGELITEDKKLAPEFKKIVARAIKEASSMTMDEAKEAAKNFRLTKSDAATLYDIFMAATDLNINKFSKKVQVVSTKEMNAAISSVHKDAEVKKNPKDETKLTQIAAHDKVKPHNLTYPYMKKIVKA